jgi:hypothetical protein
LAHKGAHIWIGGDFNLPGIDWQNVNIKHNSQHTAECHQLLDISKNAFLDQLVLEPTRITETQSNTLDLFFTKCLIFTFCQSIPGRLKSPPNHMRAPLCAKIFAK